MEKRHLLVILILALCGGMMSLGQTAYASVPKETTVKVKDKPKTPKKTSPCKKLDLKTIALYNRHLFALSKDAMPLFQTGFTIKELDRKKDANAVKNSFLVIKYISAIRNNAKKSIKRAIACHSSFVVEALSEAIGRKDDVLADNLTKILSDDFVGINTFFFWYSKLYKSQPKVLLHTAAVILGSLHKQRLTTKRASKVLPGLMRLLQTPVNPVLDRMLTGAIAQLTVSSKDQILPLLKSKQVHTRRKAYQILAYRGCLDADICQTLKKGLEDPSPEVQEALLRRMLGVGKAFSQLKTTVQKLSKSKNAKVKQAAKRLMASMIPHSK